ncbi:MAG: P27 family phage terminase small subunit [Actinomycetota bacterium]|jgi:phage terminase small subunit|nr:P27 family phage terminase small subunit [Actinomycetota bacterium]
MAGQGRKPKTDAIRRTSQPKVVDSASSAIAMPAEVEGNALMRECWEWTVGDGAQFVPADTPMLILLAQWWAVARQCSSSIAAEEGDGVITQVMTPMGMRQNPDVKTLKEATNQMRQLSSELGIGPLSRTRMGLMRMTAASMAADLPAKIFELIDSADGD